MKVFHRLSKRFLLLITPLAVSSVFAPSPSYAATFASSDALLEFSNFSQSPSSVVVDTDSLTIVEGSMVDADADAEGVFTGTPPTAFNFAFSEASGESRDFLGIGASEALFIGSFSVAPDIPFTFDFTADLTLETLIDNPQAESANASGDIFWALVNDADGSIVEFFSLSAGLTTPSDADSDFLTIENSDNVILSSLVESLDTGDLEEFAEAFIFGSVQRTFTIPTSLTLVEFKSTQVKVTAPEPSIGLALLLSSGIVGLVLRGQRKAKPSLS